jgi:hypothetical protein
VTAPTNPHASSLPGISHVRSQFSWSSNSTGTGNYVDSNEVTRNINFYFESFCGVGQLRFHGDGEVNCSFEQCGPPNQNLWYATALIVGDTRCGIATNVYALARDLLQTKNASITPSGSLTTLGAAFWNKLDPNLRAQFRPHPTIPGDFSF